ncbi:organic hydroperoxide resistance protein [Radicibacter daui]|uniref:organic hydroperoxide resistance protein n=1 Tax=Radicibacter daui TaxID=3064829 RepID=UPI0040468C6E
MKVLYQTSSTATGGRDGSVRSEDGELALKLTVPKELGGPGGGGHNPEQLFSAGYSACFLGAMRFVAGQEKITVPADATVKATVGIGANDKGPGFAITVALEVTIPGMDRATAEKLVATAHTVCPYSNATRGNVDVQLSVA